MSSSSPSVPSTMKAMVLRKCIQKVDIESSDGPLEFETDFSVPTTLLAPHQVLLRVICCGVCHTELDIIEGRTPPAILPVILGHQIVGRVVKMGEGVSKNNLALNDRVGVAWIYSSDGSSSHENVSDDFVGTGRDVHGGYAEYMLADGRYCYKIPESLRSSVHVAPLLCAGAVGYRSLRLTGILDHREDAISSSEPLILGLQGFGGSGHIVLQCAKHILRERVKVFVFCRTQEVQEFAISLGADWAGNIDDVPPSLLDACIDTTPVWKPVICALQHLKPSGRLVINAIRKESHDQGLLSTQLSYHDHLWMEKEIKSVANVCGNDVREFLDLAAEMKLRPSVKVFRLEQANQALIALKQGTIKGSYVLQMVDDDED